MSPLFLHWLCTRLATQQSRPPKLLSSPAQAQSSPSRRHPNFPRATAHDESPVALFIYKITSWIEFSDLSVLRCASVNPTKRLGPLKQGWDVRAPPSRTIEKVTSCTERGRHSSRSDVAARASYLAACEIRSSLAAGLQSHARQRTSSFLCVFV
uniref:Uncharacterized protein n=1 Tax=Ixodes ricinus TaxID=34613 RepID=A0A6B0UWK9_IXORI